MFNGEGLHSYLKALWKEGLLLSDRQRSTMSWKFLRDLWKVISAYGGNVFFVCLSAKGISVPLAASIGMAMLVDCSTLVVQAEINYWLDCLEIWHKDSCPPRGKLQLLG